MIVQKRTWGENEEHQGLNPTSDTNFHFQFSIEFIGCYTASLTSFYDMTITFNYKVGLSASLSALKYLPLWLSIRKRVAQHDKFNYWWNELVRGGMLIYRAHDSFRRLPLWARERYNASGGDLVDCRAMNHTILIRIVLVMMDSRGDCWLLGDDGGFISIQSMFRNGQWWGESVRNCDFNLCNRSCFSVGQPVELRFTMPS